MTTTSTQTTQSVTSSSSTSSEGSSPSGPSKNATLHHTSSQNALKAGIYSNRLLANEDPQLLQECIEGYVKDFEITTTAGYQLAQELAQVVLKLNRIENWQADIIESHLSKHKTRQEFAMKLNLSVIGVEHLPDWYFNACQKSRARARKIMSAYLQLKFLIDNHSADLMMSIKGTLPDLWWFVMGTSDATAKVYTFADKLSDFSSKSDPRLRLKDLCEHLVKKYQNEVLWAQDEDRYEMVLRGLKAEVQMDLLANPNLQRGETSLHRRKIDLLAQLLQLKRDAQSLKTIELESTALAPQAGVITFHENGSPADTPKKSKRANA